MRKIFVFHKQYFNCWTLLLIGIWFVQFVNSAYHQNPSEFCYDGRTCGPDTWPGLCQSGQNQSPIDIDTYIEPNYYYEWFKLNEPYQRKTIHSFWAENNGHTAVFELKPATNGTTISSENLLQVCGGHLRGCYNFAQFHFHWAQKYWIGSEHTLDGYSYPLELHIVHYKSTYQSLKDALDKVDDPTAIAVFAVLFQIGDYNPYLAPIIRSLPKVRKPEQLHQFNHAIRISDLFPFNQNSYYTDFARYLGSLTTPNCNEQVIWTVFLQAVQLSREQMHEFRRLSEHEGNSNFNFRPTKPINGRLVEIYRYYNWKFPINFI